MAPITTIYFAPVTSWSECLRDARGGRIRLGRLTVLSPAGLRAVEQNALELGRDHERGQVAP